MTSPRSPAQTHILANFVLQLVMAFLHVVLAGAAVVNAVLFFYGDAGWGPYAADAADQGRRMGNLIAIVAASCWGLAGMVWAPLNAFALWNRRPWARSSTSAYWFLSMLTILGLPLSLYGLISLGRADVREALMQDDDGSDGDAVVTGNGDADDTPDAASPSR